MNHILKQIKHKLWLIFLEIEGLVDKQRLYRDIPNFKEFLRSSNKLRDSYSYYTSEVSKPDMAISYELASLLLSLSKTTKASSILDLGSGYSTYVFAQYKKNEQAVVKLWSIDDSSLWLSKTESYLKKNGLSATKLMNLKTVKKIPTKNLSFDLILHDIGTIETRINLLQYVLSLGKPGTLIIFDDMHLLPLNRAVKKITKLKDLKLYSLRSLTVDKFGRFASLVTF